MCLNFSIAIHSNHFKYNGILKILCCQFRTATSCIDSINVASTLLNAFWDDHKSEEFNLINYWCQM